MHGDNGELNNYRIHAQKVKGLDPLGVTAWGSSPGKQARPAEVLDGSEGNLKRVLQVGDDE